MNIKTLLMVTLLLVVSTEIVAREVVTIPLNLGVGPAVNYISQIISNDQPFHYSLKLDIYAILDKEFLQSHKSRIPKRYRGFIEGKDELRISYLFIPELLIISPAFKHTGIYGINFRPISLGFPLVRSRNLRTNLGVGLNVTYMFIHSDSIFDKDGSMNFLRPGLNLQFDSRVMITREFLISCGADTYFYIPQEVKDDSEILQTGEFKRALWFIAQLYIIFNFRVPYKTRI